MAAFFLHQALSCPAAPNTLAPTPETLPESAPVASLIMKDSVWSGIVPINGKIQVLSGVTLTIQPGTQVRFVVSTTRSDTDEDRIFVQTGGTLIALGTESQPIVFSSASTGSKWYGIELHSGHDRDAFAHCRIRDSRMGIAAVSSSPSIENCLFEGNQQGVSLWRQAKPALRNCTFLRNAVAIGVNMNSAPTITSCAIEDSEQIGVSVEAGSGGSVEKTRLSRNKIGIQKRGSGRLLMAQNGFDSNTVGVAIDQEDAMAEVRENVFSNNQQGVRVATKAAPRISRNVFHKNLTALRFDSRSKGSVDHNDLTANGVGVRLSRTSSPEIAWNDFSANDTAILCEYSSYPVLANNNFRGGSTAVQAGDNQSFEWTRSIWPGTEWENWARSYGRNKIVAGNNYWGEEATREMQAGSAQIGFILDYRRSKEILIEGRSYRRDEVDYLPFSPAPIPNAGTSGAIAKERLP